MLAHYVAIALRSIRATPFTSAVNVLTLAVGLVCFVTAYAAGMFWSSAEQQFRNVDDIHVVTISIKNRAQRAWAFGTERPRPMLPPRR